MTPADIGEWGCPGGSNIDHVIYEQTRIVIDLRTHLVLLGEEIHLIQI